MPERCADGPPHRPFVETKEAERLACVSPESSLLMLVCAFAGHRRVLDAWAKQAGGLVDV